MRLRTASSYRPYSKILVFHFALLTQYIESNAKRIVKLVCWIFFKLRFSYVVCQHQLNYNSYEKRCFNIAYIRSSNAKLLAWLRVYIFIFYLYLSLSISLSSGFSLPVRSCRHVVCRLSSPHSEKHTHTNQTNTHAHTHIDIAWKCSR